MDIVDKLKKWVEVEELLSDEKVWDHKKFPRQHTLAEIHREILNEAIKEIERLREVANEI